MTRYFLWFLATRPKTLGISIAPVIAGNTLAYQEAGLWSLTTLLVTLLAALTIQIGTNLHNDAVDFERGADTPDRSGPARATAQGWFKAAMVKRAAAASFTLAFLAGLYLTTVGGWPIIAIGVGSLLAGYAYTGGPTPIAYSRSGELFVFLFFGIAAVTGSYYLQAGALSTGAWLTAAAVGMLASAVLLVNNYRDLETDRTAGKLTLVNYIGRDGAQQLYSVLLLSPFLLPLLLYQKSPGPWLVMILLPAALALRRKFVTEPPGRGLNNILASTALLQLGFISLLSIGLLLPI